MKSCMSTRRAGMGAAAEDLDLGHRDGDRRRPPRGSATAALRATPRRPAAPRARSRRWRCRRGAALRRRAVELDEMARRSPPGAPASRPASAGAMISFTFATARAHVEAAERGAAVAQVHRLAAAGRGAGRRDRAADRCRRRARPRPRPSAGRVNPTRGARAPWRSPLGPCSLFQWLPSRSAQALRTAASVRGGFAIKRQRGRPDAVAVGIVGDVFDRRLAVDAGEEKARQQRARRAPRARPAAPRSTAAR